MAYVKQIAAAPEEVKMIKLSDMIENMTSVAYSIQEVGVKWADDFFLPIMNEIKPVVEGAQYVRFKKTSALLIEMMQSAYDRLQRILAIWKLI